MGIYTNWRRTVEECFNCEAADFYKHDDEKVCPNCHFAPERGGLEVSREDSWEQWWEHRRESEDISGFTGENRVRFIGGV